MNKVINISSNGIKQAIDDLVNENEMLQDKVYKLEDIIDKAIEYIENNTLYSEDYDYDEEDNLKWNGATDYKASEDLLNILKGSDIE